jgi:hypothetical protein
MSTEAPSVKEAEGEASAMGDTTPVAPDAAPVTSAAGAMGVSVMAATPPSPRAPSPAALAEEEETEEAPAKETPAIEESLTAEEAPATGNTPVEEEASVEQAEETVVLPPEAPIMGAKGACANPQCSEATSTPARSSGSGAVGGSVPSSSRGPAMDLGEPSGAS